MKKVLILSSFLPYKKTRYIAAGYNTTLDIIDELYTQNYIVDFISLVNSEQYLEKNQYNNKAIKNLTIFKITKLKKLLNKLLNIFKPVLCSVRIDSRIKKSLLKNYQQYDFIIIDYTQNIFYIKYLKDFRGRIVLIEQDVAYQAYERKHKQEKNFLKKMLYFLEYNRLKYYEEKLIGKYDLILVPSQKDFNLIKNKNKNIKIIKPFFNKIELLKKEKKEGISIGFFGAMNRKENEEAIIWFLRNIWKKIQEKYKKKIKFYIMGANPRLELEKEVKKYNGVILTGYINRIEDYFSFIDIGIVPLLTGAGIKIKTVEMLYSEIPIISTNIGIEGINIQDGKHFLLANTVEEFENKLKILIDDKNIYNNIKQNLKEDKNKLLLGKKITEILEEEIW